MTLRYISASYTPPNGILEHHGIKGQKWGIRRYQNKDGSYTKAGLKRYKKAEAERDRLIGQAQTSASVHKSNAEEYKRTYESLKKEGAKGQTMRKMYGNDIDDDNSFQEMYGMSVKDAFKGDLNYYKERERSARSGQKAWERYGESLKNLDISDLSRKDVTRKGRELLNKAMNEADNED